VHILRRVRQAQVEDDQNDDPSEAVLAEGAPLEVTSEGAVPVDKMPEEAAPVVEISERVFPEEETPEGVVPVEERPAEGSESDESSTEGAPVAGGSAGGIRTEESRRENAGAANEANKDVDKNALASPVEPTAQGAAAEGGLAQSENSSKPIFLQTLTPTPVLTVYNDNWHPRWHSDPDLEKRVLMMQNYWLSTPYAEELSAIIDRIINDRRDDPISNAICLGISGCPSDNQQPGSLVWEQHDLIQFVIFSQIVAQLSMANPALLGTVVVQDPALEPEWKSMFENRSCRVVEHPVGFTYLSETTFLFSPFVTADVVMRGMRDHLPLGNLALCVGSDISDFPDYDRPDVEKNGKQAFSSMCHPSL